MQVEDDNSMNAAHQEADPIPATENDLNYDLMREYARQLNEGLENDNEL